MFLHITWSMLIPVMLSFKNSLNTDNQTHLYQNITVIYRI